MVLSTSMLPNQLSPHPWGVLSTSPMSTAAKSRSLCCGFVCPPSIAMTPLPNTSSSTAAASKPLHSTKKNYSAEWIDLLSSDSYHSSSSSISSFPGKIDPPRSGGVSFSTPTNDKLFTFAGYAEVASEAEAPPERFVVNDLWNFVPYQESTSEANPSWGWTKVLQDKDEYIPGPRLATALAVIPSSNNDNAQAVLLGGWDPQTAGTGGVVLDDVSMLDLESLEWSQCTTTNTNTDANKEEEVVVTVPGGPTSRHVAEPLSIKHSDTEDIENVICLHNHRCEDHVLLLCGAKWEHQPTTGDVPSSRGLHCAAPLVVNTHDEASSSTYSKAMVIFGGAAKDGIMSNEAFVLDVNTWKWTKLDCGGDGDDIPSPRAGACLCPLDENSVLLFGGATPGDNGGLVGLNDVWVLHIDMEDGKGKWECLVSNDEDDDGVVRPPGRNAATLSAIDAGKLLPKDIISKGPSSADDDSKCYYFLLQGGWYPFRKTYNDVFVLRIMSSN